MNTNFLNSLATEIDTISNFFVAEVRANVGNVAGMLRKKSLALNLCFTVRFTLGRFVKKVGYYVLILPHLLPYGTSV